MSKLRGAVQRAQEDARLELEVLASHKRTRGTCGPERLKEDMKEHGVDAGIYCIRRLRKKLGIRCKQVKKFGSFVKKLKCNI